MTKPKEIHLEEHEFEISLFGPGYGESIVMHIGYSKWVVVDSFLDTNSQPIALRYLEDSGVIVKESVVLIIATHWHDDHIGGIASLVKKCPKANFCCANAFCSEEFLTAAKTIGDIPDTTVKSSGTSELQKVFSLLKSSRDRLKYASANCILLRNREYTITSLSPGNNVQSKFLASILNLFPTVGKINKKIPNLVPNEVAVVLWIECGSCTVLLGSDLEKRGWVNILENKERPIGKASVFKVPHHGSSSAHVQEVWNSMLESEPFALVAPFRRGKQMLPQASDAKRILDATPNAWITSNLTHGQYYLQQNDMNVENFLLNKGARLRPLKRGWGQVRMRRSISSNNPWKVEEFGNADQLTSILS